ncbi:hypothetical protein [Hungatella effluvii]|uniref:hypothetical protein n=1 Tax=Hungatella effluvii TaxID=1096246 RepID=UPI002A7EB7A8|nr:hypothetical protein [Hungatella effluvii]
MKKLVAAAPRVAELKDYEDRPIQSNEVRVKVEFAAPKHGTELADFRGTTPFIDGKFDNDWKVFVDRDAELSSAIFPSAICLSEPSLRQALMLRNMR